MSSRVRAPARPTLVETLDRVARLGDEYRLPVAPTGSGWIPAGALVSGGPAFQELVTAHAGDAGATLNRAIGSQLLERYLRFLWPAVAAFAIDRRVPDVSAANLLVRVVDGWPAAFALAGPSFAVLPGDPGADEATHVAPDRDALVGWLLEQSVDRNVELFVDLVQRRLGTSGTALWGNVAAAFAHPLLWDVQLVTDDRRSVIADAETILTTRVVSGLRDRVELHHVACGSEEWTVSSRRTCCLRWNLVDGEKCVGCPLLRVPQPEEGLRARVIEAVRRADGVRGAFTAADGLPGRLRRSA